MVPRRPIRTTERVVVSGLRAAIVNRSIDKLIIDTGKVTARLGDLIDPRAARVLEVLDWSLTLARGPIAVAMRLVSNQAGQIIDSAVQDRFERAGYQGDARYGVIGVSIASAVVLGVGEGIYGAIRNATGRHVSPPTNRFTRSEFTATARGGTGQTYRVYRQQIDWSHVGADGRTNLQRARNGDAPLVLKNGQWEGLELHHSRQQGSGPLFELTRSTHQRATNASGRRALHPYPGRQHPTDPVNRPAFKVDVKEYWRQRAGT